MIQLSEAIRLGAMVVPQTHVGWTDGNTACAMMSAVVAIKGIGYARMMDALFGEDGYRDQIEAELQVMFPLAAKLAVHPESRLVKDRVSSIIISLNDDRKWSREQIADWVETIEKQQQEQPEGVEAAQISA